jgi:hypothetical protein
MRLPRAEQKIERGQKPGEVGRRQPLVVMAVMERRPGDEALDRR